ncbi:hypothetical protein EJ357_33615 [Streptomyces cyaneochromogenes]|uniref:Uncharacterized protein n=1 Tax=Streptomyces cyaneochromogenes TaxID=2496836 RepID=A0A3Q9EX85_9ACTN|nr:hypothetical protein [Streptomyces cyaneochromogenes]AZQ37792.1 hypothetical protein EJ357_33615 [Streptomyces cyaneochromogenes]
MIEDLMTTELRPNHEALIEFEIPEDFHEIPLMLPPEAFEAALQELALAIWPGGTDFQREVTAAAYGAMAEALEADGTVHAAVGLFETEAGGVSIANLLVRMEKIELDRPEVIAASLHEMLSLEEHRDVHRVDLTCGPAVASFHATEFSGDQIQQPIAFAHVELYVPSPLGGDLLITTLSTPSLADLPVYVGLMSRLGDTVRFSRDNSQVQSPAQENEGATRGRDQHLTIEEETRSVFG